MVGDSHRHGTAETHCHAAWHVAHSSIASAMAVGPRRAALWTTARPAPMLGRNPNGRFQPLLLVANDGMGASWPGQSGSHRGGIERRDKQENRIPDIGTAIRPIHCDNLLIHQAPKTALAVVPCREGS